MIAKLPANLYFSLMVVQEKAKLIAIIDDDELLRIALEDLMRAVGFPAQAFTSAEDFLGSGQQVNAACIIADVRMPGISGLELQARLKSEHCRVPIIFITAHGDANMRMQALREGAVEFLQKPFDDHVLLEHVSAALGK
jgi:FixJ family two-component response regulator